MLSVWKGFVLFIWVHAMMMMVRLHLRYGVLMDLVRRSWSKIPPIELHRMERETISVAPQTAMNELGSSKWSKSKFKKNFLVSQIWSRRFLWYLHWCLLHKPPKLPIYKAAWKCWPLLLLRLRVRRHDKGVFMYCINYISIYILYI